MNAHGARHQAIDATGVTGPGTSIARLRPASAPWPGEPRQIPTATLSDRAQWIAWRPSTLAAPTPAGIVPATTSWGTPYAVLRVTPGTSAVIRSSRPRHHSRFVMMSAARVAAIRGALRRLALRAAIIRSSGIN